MPFLEAVRLAFAQIRVQKLKSFFTLLGVMIGVMFLIAVVSIVEGLSVAVEDGFTSAIVGTNTFSLRRTPGGPPDRDRRGSARRRALQRRPLLLPSEVEVARAALPPGVRASIENMNFVPGISAWGRPRSVQAIGADASYFALKKYVIARGRPFSAQDVASQAAVAVIGSEVATHFFPSLDPLGREIRVMGVPFTVIGVMEPLGSFFGWSLDRMVVAPHTSAIRRATNPRGDIDALVVQTTDPLLLADAMEEVRGVMRGIRGLAPGAEDDFSLQTSASALAFLANLKGKLIVFGTALPAIGLIVGAIVIMNIMLVAVAERTREIGIRKALGARRRDILRQFLVESASLSVLGAAFGIVLGVGIAKTIAAFTPLPAGVAAWSIPAALLLGAGVGIVAGMYPASRAARLDPIAALRQE